MVNASKNAILPILAASILSSGTVVIRQVPLIRDVHIISALIHQMGLKVEYSQDKLIISGIPQHNVPDYELSRQIRASFLLMGPLLARRGQVRISLPGGCAIGTRPIDLHLKGFEALGASIKMTGGCVIATARRLQGTHIYLDFPSVGATENIMMAAALARGTTYIENAALEPEVVDLAGFINCMGGRVSSAGSNVIKVEGVDSLAGTTYTPIPDRIEAGTYMVAAAASGGDVIINNVIPEHLKATTAKLIESGAQVEEQADAIHVSRWQEIRPVYIKTLPYPGFPTDMQPQMMALLSLAEGTSVITETIFENRFKHVAELRRMGADIKVEGQSAIIKGVEKLSGAYLEASDLRAGASLVLAALAAEDGTVLENVPHIDRGYERLEVKYNSLGARMIRVHN
ncbi:MAG TPA: UDP-N-acetylglucosamine 1-carboxyvinyltransferase [Syntrophomonas sp.]|nr:UDP-N-acetylglucosamine 1-carboxyvinyltransferase [Syntrophomonas sp.]